MLCFSQSWIVFRQFSADKCAFPLCKCILTVSFDCSLCVVLHWDRFIHYLVTKKAKKRRKKTSQNALLIFILRLNIWPYPISPSFRRWPSDRAWSPVCDIIWSTKQTYKGTVQFGSLYILSITVSSILFPIHFVLSLICFHFWLWDSENVKSSCQYLTQWLLFFFPFSLLPSPLLLYFIWIKHSVA